MTNSRGDKGAGNVTVYESPRAALLISFFTMREALGVGGFVVRVGEWRGPFEIVWGIGGKLWQSAYAL